MAIIDPVTLSSNILVSVYNRLSNMQVRRFADKSAAVKRVNKLLVEHKYQLSDSAVGDGVLQITDMVFLVPDTTPIRKKRASNAIYGGEELIRINTDVVVDENTGAEVYVNPKRAGSKAAARLQLLVDAVEMTVDQYLDACFALEGGVKARYKYRLDLSWDIEHGYIRFPGAANH